MIGSFSSSCSFVSFVVEAVFARGATEIAPRQPNGFLPGFDLLRADAHSVE